MSKIKLQTEFVEGRGYSREDWDSVDFPEMTDEELARMVPAKSILPPEFFAAVEEARRGRPRVENPRQLVSLRLDRDVLESFRSTGKGWQTRLNETLRKAAGL